jgi:uncharacterized protein YjbI with pentapeptide repeats
MDSGTALPGRGQVIDQFAQGLERLGSAELYVRIGGVYSLGHLMRSYAEHHDDIVEVLAAFVRARAACSAMACGYGTGMRPVAGTFPGQPRTTAPDVQAALTVLVHRPHRPERQKINLAGLHLAGAWLPGADLVSVWLMDADLTTAMLDHAIMYRACLRGADLARAHLDGADLTDAVLENADLSRADLKHANLTEAFFGSANLTRADLSDANLTEAFFGNANLTYADLGNSDLTRAHFDGVDLTGAHLGPSAPAVPQGWTVDPTGKLEREPQNQPAGNRLADATWHR